jgi:hypothetical protein
MNISFAPLRSDSTLTVSRQDEALILNGKTFGFSDLPEGARLQREAIEFDWFAADITRTAGALQITLVLPHGPRAPHATRFPQSVMDPADGPIPLPGANETGDAE